MPILIRNLLIIILIFLINSCAHNNNNKISQPALTQGDIAVMLPLKGKGDLASTSLAIRDGLLAAYYSSPQRSSIKIQIINTSNGDVSALYQQAVASGAKIIIGPLTKPEVQSIANIKLLPVPTIALNTLDDYQNNNINNLYQFGLLPQDEAAQVALKMAQEQLNDVAVIAPDGAWGEKVILAFEKQYRASGGRIIATLKYTHENVAGQICNFLASDAITQCIAQKHKNKKQQSTNEIMRRQDISSIFLVTTTPAQARQIVPLLKYYYAGDLPIYSISTVYSGSPKPELDSDINDIHFCDIPWVIQNPDLFDHNLQNIYKQIATNPLGPLDHNKFYALGIDAYNLAITLPTLLNNPQNGIEGASGVLYLDNFNHIYRKLQWVQISNGLPSVLFKK